MKNIKFKALKTIMKGMMDIVVAATEIGMKIPMVKNTKAVKAGDKLKYPLKWLSHFLGGTGENLEVPKEVVKEAFPVLVKAAYSWAEWKKTNGESPYIEELQGLSCVHSSTLYEGSGFWGRPSMFYMLGGFSFNIDIMSISGSDEYDWHPTVDALGESVYYTSPIGNGIPSAALMYILGCIFGHDLFVMGGFPSGQNGISNKLWEKMYEVGAKDFTSTFEYQMSQEEIFEFYGVAAVEEAYAYEIGQQELFYSPNETIVIKEEDNVYTPNGFDPKKIIGSKGFKATLETDGEDEDIVVPVEYCISYVASRK